MKTKTSFPYTNALKAAFALAKKMQTMTHNSCLTHIQYKTNYEWFMYKDELLSERERE